MERVLVVGAGTMGSGIGQACARSGYQVHLMDIKAAALDKAVSEIRWSLGKLASKGLLKDSPEAILDRITPERDLSSSAKATWVIEAALEIEDLKREIFQELDRLAPIETPLATNSSVIPTTRIAQATQHPERVLGLHFFTPVVLVDLVEVIKGEKTSPEVFERGVAFVQSLGMRALRVRRDIPGFIMNRILAAANKEALNLVAEGIANPEDVDIGTKLAHGRTVGIFEGMDYAGLDTTAFVQQSLKDLGEESLVSRSDLVERLVKQGRLGRKVGKGFYRYTPEGKRLPWGSEDEIPV